ncbi:MAG: LAGLIDADG family homing endonuclease [Candidatus Staskawiczbacteria bacterium]|nr:LAGLIDADG family homing endonuclease [Candidatus Staskawiczbacteria bacterium]
MVEIDIENKGARVIFLRKGDQKAFLDGVQSKLDIGLEDFSKIAGVCIRSMTDWKREKNSVSLSGLEALCNIAEVDFPKDVEIRDRFWYIHKGARAGGLATFKKYGRIGNENYRRKKWFEWWEKKGKFNPNQYFAQKNIFLPKKSVQLAEFIGIILGDGGITKSQVSITLNKITDLEFSFYVKKLINDLFDVKAATYNHGVDCVVNIVISRIQLVKFLQETGLKIGNKVKQQVGVPAWISKSGLFTKFCMRGLLDTDGCFYVDKHKYKDKIYLNSGINFTNRSLPLLNFFKDNLTKFGFHPTQKTKFSIFLRREEEVIRYFKEIGSSNPKHLNKFKRYFNDKSGGVG